MLKEYIRTRMLYYLVLLFIVIILFFFQNIFDWNSTNIMLISLSSFIAMTAVFIVNYIQLETNFKRVREKLDTIENPQLIGYYLSRPTHYESGYLYDMLDIIARDLYQRYKQNVDDQLEYQEYLLMFVHDLKLPIQNLKLINSSEGKLEIKKLEELTENLLNYSKISLNNTPINITSVNINDMLSEIIKSNFDFIIDKQIKVSYDCTDCIISTDNYWLSFILKQLINNAIKYCDTSIGINCAQVDDTMEISVCNDGKLLQADELGLIFDKGYTGSNSNSNATGYGLYYAQQVAAKLSCSIKVEANEKTTFKLVFSNTKA